MSADYESALGWARDAVSRAEPTQMLTLRTHAHRVLVEVLMRAGAEQEAAHAAVTAEHVALLKGDEVTAAIVRRLVERAR